MKFHEYTTLRKEDLVGPNSNRNGTFPPEIASGANDVIESLFTHGESSKRSFP